MKKYFLILPFLLLSFFIAKNSFALTSGNIYSLDKIPAQSLNCQDNNNFVLIYPIENNLSINYSTCLTPEIYWDEIMGDINQYPDNSAYFVEVNTEAVCDLLNYDECINSIYFVDSSLINYHIGNSPDGASVALLTISGALLNSSIDLTKNVFINYWPFILIIGIIAGFIAFILKKLPRRWPK